MATKQELYQKLRMELDYSKKVINQERQKIDAILSRMCKEGFDITKIMAEMTEKQEYDVKLVSKKELEKQITQMMNKLGVVAKIKGYQYMRTAIMLVYEKPELINALEKELYPAVAKIYRTKVKRVERAMWYATEVGYSRRDDDAYLEMFGPIMKKPKTSEFILKIAERLRFQM